MKLLLAMLPTILLTAYCQIIVKWRVAGMVASAGASDGLAARAMRYLADPYILSAFACSLLSAIAWLYVAERYPVSTAFPAYVGVLFAIVTLGGMVLLKESVAPMHLLGLVLIFAGVAVISRVA